MMDQRRQRAARVRGKVDYAKLHGAEPQSDDEHHVDQSQLAQTMLSYGQYTSGSCRHAAPADISSSFFHNNFAEPVLVPPSSAAVQHLGMVLPPPADLKVPEVAKMVGYEKEVATFSVATQGEGHRWNLLQWLQYWCTRESAKERKMGERKNSITSLDDEADSRDVKRREWEANIRGIKVPASVPRGISAESRRRLFQASLPVSGTPLEDAILSPRAVREGDLVERFWPAQPGEEAKERRPQVALQLSMEPAGSFCNFRIGPGGAATWLHVISGTKVFALLPPTRDNLAAYVGWATAARHAGVFLPEHAPGCVKVEVPAGATLFVPGGWVYAEATPTDSVAVGGHFLHAGALPMQLQVGLIEEHLALRRQYRFPHFYQVLWYTAAHYARRLMELCPLSPEDVREKAAQKSRARQAAAEAAAAEQAAKAAASRAASADRKARLQKLAQASPVEPKQEVKGRGSTAVHASGGARASRQAHRGAAPQKRQRRVSQKMQEAMEDPEADFLPSDSGEDDALPPRSLRRLHGRFQNGSASSGGDLSQEDVEEEEEDESSDEELRAMANIRRRRQRQAAPPKVRLRTGAGAAAAAAQPQATPPKLRIKYSAGGAAAAQPPPAASADVARRKRAKWWLDDDEDDDVAELQPARQPGRTTSLKLKLKFSDGGGSIPQVDGAADTDEEASPAEPPSGLHGNHTRLDAELNGRQTPPANPAGIGAAADILEKSSVNGSKGAMRAEDAPEAAGAQELAGDVSAAAGVQQDAATAPKREPGQQGDATGVLAEGAGRLEDEKAANAAEPTSERPVEGEQEQAKPAEAAGAQNGNGSAAESEQMTVTGDLPPAEAEPAHIGAASLVAPEVVAAALPAAALDTAQTEERTAGSPPEEEQAAVQHSSKAGRENGHAVKLGAAEPRAARLLSEREREGVPALVHALRRWLREMGGHPCTGREDPEGLLDELEVCLAALGIPVAPVPPPVDFDSLPTLKLPSSALAVAEAVPEDSGGEGTGLQGDSDDELLEEEPQEELGDSTLEAKARGTRQKAGSNLGGRGGTRKKPSVRDRLAKKLRIR